MAVSPRNLLTTPQSAGRPEGQPPCEQSARQRPDGMELGVPGVVGVPGVLGGEGRDVGRMEGPRRTGRRLVDTVRRTDLDRLLFPSL